MYMNAYHKVQGEVRMFEVDARNAIAQFPEEWSSTSWEAPGDKPTTANKLGRTKTASEPGETIEGSDR